MTKSESEVKHDMPVEREIIHGNKLLGRMLKNEESNRISHKSQLFCCARPCLIRTAFFQFLM